MIPKRNGGITPVIVKRPPDGAFHLNLFFFQRRTDSDLAWVVPIRLFANPMYAAHFAIADIDRKTFRYLDRRSHTPPFLQKSGAALDKFELQLGDWEISGDEKIHRLKADLDRDLKFTADLKPVKPYVKNGHRYPIANPQSDQESSTHFSCTRMEINGEIRDGGLRESFTGTGWMDREFGTWFQRKWDWFSIQLDNDCELMIYRMWDELGETSDRSHGTFVDAKGKARFFTFEEFEVTATKKWKSPTTGTEYPSGWKIHLDEPEIEIEVTPLLKDQELNTEDTTMVIYWEGACEVKGTLENKDVKGKAFVELVGYTEGYQQPSLFRMIAGTIKG